MKAEDIDLTELLHGATDDSSSDLVIATRILDYQCSLGEGIVFDDRAHTLYWTDINSSRFHKLILNYEEPAKVRFCTYDLPRKLGSFAMLQKDYQVGNELPLLCAWEDGFQLYDMEEGKPLSEYSEGEDVNPLKGPTRLNDGRVDRDSKFFVCGGYYGGIPECYMKVFRVEQNPSTKTLSHHALVEKIQVTNSISWDPSGKIMYLADSPTRSIHKYDYCGGVISNKTFLHRKQEDEIGSVPDGSCVDADGFLWNAVWRGGSGPGMVQRIDPNTGLVVFTVHIPDHTSQTTCCCFGGKDLDILFITTAGEHRESKDEPHAGALYAIKLPFKGLPESRLNFAI